MAKREVKCELQLVGLILYPFPFGLEFGRDVGREYGKEDHSGRGKDNGKNLPDLGDSEDIGSHGGNVHQCPVESVPIGLDGRVDVVFHVVEYDAAKVDRGEKYREIGGKKIGYTTTGHPAYDERYPVYTSC